MMRPGSAWRFLILPVAIASSASASTVGYWRFEEGKGATTADVSGNGNTGNLSGGFVYSGDTPLIDGGNSFSLELDGTGAVSISDSASLRPEALLTLEAWIKPAAETGIIVRKKLGAAGSTSSFRLELQGELVLTLGGSSGSAALSSPLPPLQEWHHVAGTWDGARMRTYVDGAQGGCKEFAGPVTFDGGPVLIGAWDGGEEGAGCLSFQGRIDEVRISDTALTPPELLLLGASSSESPFRRGDVDANRQLQITDALFILGFLFLGGNPPSCLDAADVDDNGAIEVTDAIRILGYLFLGGLVPPAPGPFECGADLTPDCLSCSQCF